MRNLIKTFLITPILLLCFFVFPQHAAGLTFGFTGVGGTSYAVDGDYIFGSKATPAEAGTATSISVYLHSSAYDDGPRKLGLYKVSDGSFIGGTAEYSGETPADWATHDLESSVAITTVEYVIAHFGEEYSFKYDLLDDKGNYLALAYPGSFPNPITWDSTTHPMKFSIYCTYTAGGAEEEAPKKQDVIWFN